MKTLSYLIMLLAFALGLTSCFEIREEVDMNSDGSGTLMLTINLSDSKDQLKSMMNMGEFQGNELPSQQEIEGEIAKFKKTLSDLEGISNVDLSTDFENFIFSLNGKFANVKALNNAINKLANDFNQTTQPIDEVDNFGYSMSSFSRLFKYPIEYIKEEEYKQIPSMQRFVMETGRLVHVYRFKKEIKRFSNKKATLSPSKKAIKLENSIADLILGKSSIENQINF